MIASIHQPHYLPWLGYFDKIRESDIFVFLDNVQYKHREYQNRNKIRTKDGWMWLTVPVITKGLRDQAVRDVKIDNERIWQERHWRSMAACYGNSGFFSDHFSFFEEVYTKTKWTRLVDLNVCIIKYILEVLGIDTPLHFESEIGTSTKSTERIIEICKKVGADTYLSGSGGRSYMEEERFAQEGIELRYQSFNHPVYTQCFARDKGYFIPNMAAVDLLFNEGGRSTEILKGALS